MSITKINSRDPGYPGSLSRYLRAKAPEVISLQGNPYLLESKSLAVFASSSCPDDIAVNSFLLAQHLRRSSVTAVSGFHSPVEHEFLTILLGATSPIIICPSREIESMRIPAEYKEGLDSGRLLLLSPFSDKKRPSSDMAVYRNKIVAALAEEVFVAYAEPGGKLQKLCKEVIDWGKRVYTFAGRLNKVLISMGAEPIFPDHVFFA
ncbi:MAG TPA: DNA-processing protein DprA [Blastocatellia bacterium]|nr:DNA-processing protein DprA [Blastocatellia bacterium]